MLMQGRSKRFVLTLTLSLFVISCYLTVKEYGWPISHPYFGGPVRSVSSQEQPNGLSRIVFLETGHRKTLSARLACAVESAARLHPSWTVHLLSVADTLTFKRNAGSHFARALRTFPNVVMDEIKPQEVFRGTPLESWYKSGALNQSAHPIEHLADALRLAEIFNRGGIYLDFDVVVMRSLAALPLSFVSQSPSKYGDMVSNGFLGFRAGDPFLLALMKRASRAYKPSEWASIGPELLRLEALSRCGGQDINAVVGRRCNDGIAALTVLPHRFFLPVPYNEWTIFFNSNASLEAWSRCDESYVMHVFNKMSSLTPAPPGCAYRQAAEIYCPESLRQSLALVRSF